MKTDEFDFDLPQRLIAQHPVTPRDAARLLVVGEELEDRAVRDLPSLLRPGDVMVFNDTRVIPARLKGRRGDAKIEITLHRSLPSGTWHAFARPARRLRVGDRIVFASDFRGRVLKKHAGGEITIALETADGDVGAALRRHGAMPLPPYIRRPDGADFRDFTDYQTVYAAEDGAVAAPTAGLHFTPELMDALERRGIVRTMVTLHVGAGTFLPIRTEEIEAHRMHPETGRIDPAAAEAVNRARAKGGRIVAVGSTALRLLESAADESGRIIPFEGETELFIRPGYHFRAVDLFITNFHLPRSTLFVLVCAFAGTSRMKAAYAHAMRNGYRFYSYGDCCLLHPAGPAAGAR